MKKAVYYSFFRERSPGKGFCYMAFCSACLEAKKQKYPMPQWSSQDYLLDSDEWRNFVIQWNDRVKPIIVEQKTSRPPRKKRKTSHKKSQ